VNVFGYHFALLTILQVVTTVLVIGVLAFYSAMQEARADHESDWEILLLCSVVLPNHPVYSTLSKVSEASDEELKDQGQSLYYFDRSLTAFTADGVLPSEEVAASAKLGEHFVVCLIAPAAAWLGLWFFTDEMRRYRSYRLEHTKMRRNIMSKIILVCATDLLYLAIGAELINDGFRRLGFTISGVVALGLLGCIGCFSVCVIAQRKWKSFWTDALIEIMGKSAKDNNHDLFNRAQLLRNNVESQPEIPLPVGAGAYAAIYSSVQLLLVWFFKLIAK